MRIAKMTPIHKYKLPIKYRHPNALRNTIVLMVVIAALFGIMSVQADQQLPPSNTALLVELIEVKSDREKLLGLLNGELVMVDEEHGSKYVVIESVTWRKM